MKILKEKEAVHCRTQEEFEKVAKIIEPSASKDLINGGYNVYKEDSHIVQCGGVFTFTKGNLLKKKDYKILSYSEFMEDEWKPNFKSSFWFLCHGKNKIAVSNSIIYDAKKYNKVIGMNNFFRTRELARKAKKKIEQVLMECKHG